MDNDPRRGVDWQWWLSLASVVGVVGLAAWIVFGGYLPMLVNG